MDSNEYELIINKIKENFENNKDLTLKEFINLYYDQKIEEITNMRNDALENLKNYKLQLNN